METKSAIGILEGKMILAVLCETGDYVDLAPRLQKHWTDPEKIKKIISQGNQKCILDDVNIPSDEPLSAVRFFSLTDFMIYFENRFCENFYIMENGIWYYADPGDRNVSLLSVKLLPLLNPKHSDSPVCEIHGHAH